MRRCGVPRCGCHPRKLRRNWLRTPIMASCSAKRARCSERVCRRVKSRPCWTPRMLRVPDIDHILRAAAAITNHARFVVVGTGAVIITATHIPAEMMMTAEIDLYADGIADPEPISDLIDATIGQGSMFHRTFHYYGDGVGPRTAIM